MRFVLCAVAFVAVIAGCLIYAATIPAPATIPQVRDCKAAIRFAAARGPITERPALCAALTGTQYREALVEGTRRQRVRSAG